ncbi:hypothetical protein [Acetobacter aceti]|nr:hypothetical protein [Acetobacter aceti]
MRAASLSAELKMLLNELLQRNLNNAVKLAIEAAQGRGELVEHFAELGRRYGGRTDTRPRRRKAAAFRVIPGGLS